MNKNNLSTILICASPLLFNVACKTAEEPGPMNILYIFSDDLNDWTSVMGGHPQAKTPNIERLAAMGVTFMNAHCPSPACGPARASILTGFYPPKTGVLGNADNFRDNPGTADAITLPQYFSAHGYHTIAAGKVFHHPRGAGDEPSPYSDDISWDEHWRGQVGTKAPNPFPEQPLDIPTDDYFGRAFVWGPSPETTEETFDYQLSKFIADFVNQEHEKPFLAAAGIFRPHLSWFVPQEFFDMFPLDEIILPKVYENDLDDIPDVGLGFIKPLVQDELVRKDLWKEAVRAYLANIAFADHCIGVLLDAIEASDYKDNTIIVLMGDHGWHLGEKKHWSKFTLWERATRTTFMMHVPGMVAGQKCNAPVNLIDLYPTLVDLCGLPPKNDLEGNSLRPLLEDPDANWPHVALTYYQHPHNYSIRDESWRYIHYHDGTEELYYHPDDPHEWHNVIDNPRSGDIIRELRRRSGLGENHRLFITN